MADLAGARGTLGPRDLYSLPIVGWCALHPERTAVAYVVTRLDEEVNAYRGSIRSVPIDDGAICQSPPTGRIVTEGSARDQAPQWSADGKKIFFLSDRSGNTQLWAIDPAGGDASALPVLPGNVSEFAVSPNGSCIAAIATPTQNKDEIERRGWRRITRLRYRSDGPGYLDDKPQIWLLDLKANSATQITDGSGFVAGVAWNPKGTSLAFCGDHEADADSLWRRELWTASPSDNWRLRKIARFETAIEVPSWSPDAGRIAFCGIEEAHGAGGMRNLRVFVVDATGQNLTCWTPHEDWTCGNFILTDVGAAGSLVAPVWVSEGEVAVLGSYRGAAQVFRASAGKSAVALTPATMSVTHFAAVSSNAIVHCSSDQATPPELYVSRGSNDATRLTRETEEWSSRSLVAPATHLAVASAGQAIDAWHLSGIGPTPRPCIL